MSGGAGAERANQANVAAAEEGTALPRLSRATLDGEAAARYDRMKAYPVKVLQIGEGNFLRGFADWMIDRCNRQGLFEGGVAVCQPRPSGAAKLAELREQDGLYYQWIRGLQDGRPVDELDLVSVFAVTVDPYAQWDRFLALGDLPELEVVVSNTTEAGLAYQASEWQPERPILSYPGKLTALLHRRFETFGGDSAKGLLLLPCELVENNGDKLRDIVLRHAEDWGLPEAFKSWIRAHNRFLNNLVDRIVTGYPAEEAGRVFAAQGTEDRLLNAAEPYHLWAIEGEAALDARLPLARAGLNVLWTDDLRPYQLRKVRILNGAHTLMASVGLLNGLETVGEAVGHPVYGELIRDAIINEIVPSVPLPEDDMRRYAGEVLERFANPHVRHKLADIALNSLSKFKVRLLPTLEAYAERTGGLPPRIVEAFASLLRLYRARETGDGGFAGSRLDGRPVALRDDAATLTELAALWARLDRGELTLEGLVADILGRVSWWGRDLGEIKGLRAALTGALTKMEASGS
ncbi:tagaturonate reductase [Cohnella sp. OV330]|uniref:tagaturonate reductase n=1 Tax=Cohnella sp. OV330 TaxID=1855288 RepID=UPI0008E7DF2A|nr:tagaturonate reductase [Cohnella sp. OV330]SFB56114.1 tagaturonate reductase [Cohnella sp. OV330]